MRIAIIGNSGSGKSTLAGQLAASLQVETLDLDTLATHAALFENYDGPKRLLTELPSWTPRNDV